MCEIAKVLYCRRDALMEKSSLGNMREVGNIDSIIALHSEYCADCDMVRAQRLAAVTH